MVIIEQMEQIVRVSLAVTYCVMLFIGSMCTYLWLSLCNIQYGFADIDECSQSFPSCGSTGLCRNTIGSFVCHCQPGFLLRGSNCGEFNAQTKKSPNLERSGSSQYLLLSVELESAG